MLLPRPTGTPPIEMSFQWPEHGRPLNLGAVEPSEGQSLSAIVDELWLETLRVAKAVGLASPARLQSIQLSWVSRGGRSSARLFLGGNGTLDEMADAFRAQFEAALAEHPPLRLPSGAGAASLSN
ncbi:MAG: hypothetical protein AAFZ65_10675 [Planctomycetota bacterium]